MTLERSSSSISSNSCTPGPSNMPVLLTVRRMLFHSSLMNRDSSCSAAHCRRAASPAEGGGRSGAGPVLAAAAASARAPARRTVDASAGTVLRPAPSTGSVTFPRPLRRLRSRPLSENFQLAVQCYCRLDGLQDRDNVPGRRADGVQRLHHVLDAGAALNQHHVAAFLHVNAG